MKYLDKGLSPENLQLLSAWIDRRESGQRFVDARRRVDREWWEMQQAMRNWKKNPPRLEPYTAVYQPALQSLICNQQANAQQWAYTQDGRIYGQ